MQTPITYQLQDNIATITIDDGKKNALSLEALLALHESLSRAQADNAIVLLTGREGILSGGFDLHQLGGGGEVAYKMVLAGFRLAERILSSPMPVVIACPGHAVAMGSFLLLSADYRIGAAGEYKIGANEVALGLTMPFFAIELCRQRLAPAHYHRAVMTAELYRPEDAVNAGFLDRVVPAAELHATAQQVAVRLSKLNLDAYLATKLRAKEAALKAIKDAILADDESMRGML